MLTFRSNFGPNKILAISIIAVFALTIVPPALAADQADQQKSDFCSRLSFIAKDIIANIDANRSSIDNGRPNFVNGIKQRRDNFDGRLKSARSLWDQRRNQQYAALADHAKTAAQKTAVEDYRSTIESAIATRRTAVDLAISNFRTAVDAKIDSDRGNIDAVATEFKNQVQAAINTAQSDCSKAAPSDQVRQGLTQSLQSIRLAFEQNSSAVDQVKNELIRLDQQKRDSIETAIGQFKQTAETAAQSLKASLGGDQSLAKPSMTNSL
ncbi:hypothetical protein HYX70_00440 [Candidatus Saccharibacteria bacterium]|nr:hypothetical protein [Candidatus Saccharibacteria bacterium]